MWKLILRLIYKKKEYILVTSGNLDPQLGPRLCFKGHFERNFTHLPSRRSNSSALKRQQSGWVGWRDQYCNYNIYICTTFLALWARVFIKHGVRGDKQAEFLRRARWEGCLITLCSSDKDNAAAARKINLLQPGERRQHLNSTLAINTSPFTCYLYKFLLAEPQKHSQKGPRHSSPFWTT